MSLPIRETGWELIARLSSRPSICDLDRIIFPNGLQSKQTVELCGNLSSGKSLLLTQFIAKCILPKNYNGIQIEGLNSGVLLINNDHHIMMTKLRDLILSLLLKINKFLKSDIDKIILDSFENLHIINCYDSLQLFFTIQTLDSVLFHNDNIGLVAIDSITAFYWQERERGGPWIIDEYVEKNLKLIQKHTFQWKVPLIYTKPVDLLSNLRETISLSLEPIIGKINYRIKLKKNDELQKFNVSIETLNNQKIEKGYEINENGIRWINLNLC